MNFLNNNFIAEGLVIALKWLFSFLGDYAIAIILMTIAIRLVLLPLDIKQRRNSFKMSSMAAEIEGIKERYANNPEQANKKVQELYRERNVKPSAGCLPMVIQMILLFAFFGAMRAIASNQTIGMILDAVQNGGEVTLPSFLWVHNLWQPDSGLPSASILPTAENFASFIHQNSANISPQTLAMLKNEGIVSFANNTFAVNTFKYNYFVEKVLAFNGTSLDYSNGYFILPVLAGGTLFIQQKFINKTQNTPKEQQSMNKMMLYFFPLFSVYICCTSNAAFAIYWIVGNLFAMAVQLVFNAIQKKKNAKEADLPERLRTKA